MLGRTSLNVSLTPELGQFVEERVATGRYQTASEVIREGLRLLEKAERREELTLEALKAKLGRGSAQADRGEVVDPQQALEKIETLKLRRGARAAEV